MSALTYAIEMDLDRDGSYETDITSYVQRPGRGIVIDRAVDVAEGGLLVSKLEIDLANRSGDWTPQNSASPFYGQVSPGIPIRVRVTHSAVDYTLWTGYVQAITVTGWSGSVSVAQLVAYDIAYFLANSDAVNITTATTRDTDGALIAIMDALGLVSGDRDFDDGVQDLPLHFVAGQRALDAWLDVVASEMGGLPWVTAEGLLRFENRVARLGVGSVDQTWGDGTAMIPNRIDYKLDEGNYVTSARCRGTVFVSKPTGSKFTLLQLSRNQRNGNAMALAAGETWTRTYQGKATYLALETPVAYTDYRANSAANGSGTDQTASLSVTISDLGGGRITVALRNASGATIYVMKFRLRGQPVEFYSDRAEAVYSLPIPGLKAGRGIEFDVPFVGDSSKIRDYAYQELRVGRYPYPELTLYFDAAAPDPANDSAKKVALLSLELGNKIRYTDVGLAANGSYTDDWFYVRGIHIEIPPDFGGASFMASAKLVPTYIFRNLDKIAFDTFGRGNAVNGLGSTDNLLAWNSSTGFDINTLAARPNSTGLQQPYVAVDSSDIVVEVSLSNLSGDTDEECGVIFRRVDADNNLAVYVDDGDDLIHLAKIVATVESDIATAAWTPADTAELRVIAQGDRIRVWLDRVLVIDEEDSTHNTGVNAGLFSRSTTAVFYDNFYAEAA